MGYGLWRTRFELSTLFFGDICAFCVKLFMYICITKIVVTK